MPKQKPEWDGAEVEVSLTLTFKYKLVSESYGEAKTIHDALDIDMTNLQADPVGAVFAAFETDDQVDILATWRKI